MKITLRADEANGTHTRFTVFVNGANAGQLCMLEEEAVTFYQIVSNGCCSNIDTFVGKGRWSIKYIVQTRNPKTGIWNDEANASSYQEAIDYLYEAMARSPNLDWRITNH